VGREWVERWNSGTVNQLIGRTFDYLIKNKKKMQTHKDLEVWQMGTDLVENVYRITGAFPKEEMCGLAAQIRRSAISIPSNIAEGAARKGNAEFIQFLYISLGSLSELETQILIAKRLDYL